MVEGIKFYMLYTNPLWIADIDTVSENLQAELDELAGSSVLITGASGLICSAVVDVLFRYNNTHTTPIKILAAGRSAEKMRGRFGEMIDRGDFEYVPYDSSRSDQIFHVHADYIIHGGANAYPAMITKEPVETMLGNFTGVKVLLDYAREQGTKRFLYISSSEVYGKKEGSFPYREDEYGYVDLLNPRSSYAVGKRAAETLCVSYAAEYGVNSVIVRPGHVYGPTASSEDNRVSSAWAYAAARGEDIIMKSDGSQLRSYCYCLDCASAIIKVLQKGENFHAYNISNPDSVISIRKLGEILSQSGNVNLRIVIPSVEERKEFNPMQNSSLDSKSLHALGWRGLFTAEVGLDHTEKILKQTGYTLHY